MTIQEIKKGNFIFSIQTDELGDLKINASRILV